MKRPTSDEVLASAANRVDYRLQYGKAEDRRDMLWYGIGGEDIPNAYYGRECHHEFDAADLRLGVKCVHDEPMGSGQWDDPEHPTSDETTEAEHIDAWFASAVRESIHEALEWFWVDDRIFLDPHGKFEDKIHALSGEFVSKLLALREGEARGTDDEA